MSMLPRIGRLAELADERREAAWGLQAKRLDVMAAWTKLGAPADNMLSPARCCCPDGPAGQHRQPHQVCDHDR
jgi:hypothetical protein